MIEENKISEQENKEEFIFNELLDRQQPLGTEFEKILNENLWDLYGS